MKIKEVQFLPEEFQKGVKGPFQGFGEPCPGFDYLWYYGHGLKVGRGQVYQTGDFQGLFHAELMARAKDVVLKLFDRVPIKDTDSPRGFWGGINIKEKDSPAPTYKMKEPQAGTAPVDQFDPFGKAEMPLQITYKMHSKALVSEKYVSKADQGDVFFEPRER